MPRNVKIDEDELCRKYTEEGLGTEELSKVFHIGKKRVRQILNDRGIERKKRGGQVLRDDFVVQDWKIVKYPEEEGYHYEAIDEKTGYKTRDYMNNGGFLTSYIKSQYKMEIPTLYDRRMYYKRTGNYWWEQWFTIVKVKDGLTKKCPYCNWETVDVDNKSGMFVTHLSHVHGLTVEQHLQSHPEDEEYFNTKRYRSIMIHKQRLNDKSGFVVCPLCGEKFEKITESHVVNKHGINLSKFKALYPHLRVSSDIAYQQVLDFCKNGNLHVSKSRFISSYERELQDFFDSHNIKYEPNRQILIGREIDLLMPDHKIGIEFDGLMFHSEIKGKKPYSYHVKKTDDANNAGYGLIHIFEDEWLHHKDIVIEKLKHIFNIDSDMKYKIDGRKCEIHEITGSTAAEFLDKYHIQGHVRSSVNYGAYYRGNLIGVMCFTHISGGYNEWELKRFATDYRYIMRGVGGKLFKYFINQNEPSKVITYGDRRWILDGNNNIYTKLGFELTGKTQPNYTYFNPQESRNERISRTTMKKRKMVALYGFPETMTEWEMARELGYDRIWDCGLFKYVYYNK